MHFIKQFAGTLTKDLYNQKSCSPFKFWLQADTCQGFSKKYHNSILLKWFQSYNPAKLAVKKNMRHFGFEATFSASSYSKSLLSERPGFDSRRAQTLKACIFEVLWPFLIYDSRRVLSISDMNYERKVALQHFKAELCFPKMPLLYIIK